MCKYWDFNPTDLLLLGVFNNLTNDNNFFLVRLVTGLLFTTGGLGGPGGNAGGDAAGKAGGTFLDYV